MYHSTRVEAGAPFVPGTELRSSLLAANTLPLSYLTSLCRKFWVVYTVPGFFFF